MKKPFIALLLFCVTFCAVAETQRFAVVNLERVFKEYYKSKIAEDAIKQQAEIYRTYLVKQNSQLIQLRREAEKLKNDTQNAALSETDRAKVGADAVIKAREVVAKEAELQLYAAERTKTMREIERVKREEIMTDIYKEVDRRSTAEGFNFVFDSSGKTLNEQPLVLRFPASCDLTDAVIRELNRAKSVPEEKKATVPGKK
ncbi:MAG: OmpH family outer membrane protein [Victivallales bacterium]|jgi:Skp family chaperone for outer membrane proteins|nr:OmpH family outer membrane protein [Victivallales bacterium]